MDLTKKVNVLFAALVPAVGLAGNCGSVPEGLQPCAKETEEADCGEGRYCNNGQCADYKEGQQPQGYTCEDAARNLNYVCTRPPTADEINDYISNIHHWMETDSNYQSDSLNTCYLGCENKSDIVTCAIDCHFDYDYQDCINENNGQGWPQATIDCWAQYCDGPDCT